MWKLVIEDDEGKRTVVPLSRDEYTIGRQEGNTIRLTERNVSRQHARVRRARTNGAGQAFVLEDLRSYNGVFVNGLRVAHTQELQHGDLVQVGDYRVVLQDDAADADATIPIAAVPADAKSTVPLAPSLRGQTLAERPNRLVMLVGPTPGLEYPLVRERMTIGRAEDSSISVNHNSVSRLHCEVHALGDGRFEIVDKASSNGVRVNAVELRRSIIEAGDVIELGDVRFKFIGAGQVFVPGPNESQQLTAISDRDAELALPRRGLGGYAVPILGAGVVGAMIILGFVYVLRARGGGEVPPPTAAVADTEESRLAEARRRCSPDDCEEAHTMVATFPATSPLREHTDFRWVTTTWAESLLRRARAEHDPAARRAIVDRILADPRVDAAQKTAASDLLVAHEPVVAAAPASALPEPSASAAAPVAEPTAVALAAPPPRAPAPSPAPAPRPPATSHATITNATTTSAPTTPPRPPQPTALEKAREAALRGEPAAVRQLLEQKVRGGRGTPEEANLVRQACKAMGDRACSDDVKAKYP